MFLSFIQGLWESGKVTEAEVREFIGDYLTQVEAEQILNIPKK